MSYYNDRSSRYINLILVQKKRFSFSKVKWTFIDFQREIGQRTTFAVKKNEMLNIVKKLIISRASKVKELARYLALKLSDGKLG